MCYNQITFESTQNPLLTRNYLKLIHQLIICMRKFSLPNRRVESRKYICRSLYEHDFFFDTLLNIIKIKYVLLYGSILNPTNIDFSFSLCFIVSRIHCLYLLVLCLCNLFITIKWRVLRKFCNNNNAFSKIVIRLNITAQ